jgi:hypothetical protein
MVASTPHPYSCTSRSVIRAPKLPASSMLFRFTAVPDPSHEVPYQLAHWSAGVGRNGTVTRQRSSPVTASSARTVRS